MVPVDSGSSRRGNKFWFVSAVENLRTTFVQGIILIARAANGGETPFMVDSSERPSEASKCLMLELTSTPLDLHLREIGQFELDGPALTDAIHTESDGKSLLHRF